MPDGFFSAGFFDCNFVNKLYLKNYKEKRKYYWLIERRK